MSLPPRAPGWKYDIPSSSHAASSESILTHLDPPPNQMNTIFLEIPRSTLKIRGISIILMPPVLLFTIIGSIGIFLSMLADAKLDLELFFAILALCILSIFATIPYLRFELGLPRDEPIRFNRHRRKVYFYQYRMNRLNPFGRKGWGVQPIAYDWDALTAEVYRMYLPMGYGGLKEEVRISVRDLESGEVIDRFFLSDDIQEGEQYWAIARLFMQEGPDAIPDFIHPPRDWNEEKLSNPFDQRAPKVKWPAEMDLESRTAPDQVEQSSS
ncbi:DUF6708 domain-containing protein [Pseudomonas sp. NPDC089752]|uniref:DUF6708 domain-containing protein n=1 Tax=Pseudomonas sp. NPDC089752 TaxID=3364472 RepID=UPI00381E039F